MSETPRCPVCGEEMKFNALKYHKCWSCFQDNHGFTGPADDEYGDATRAMIETMRQEARIETLENYACFQYGQLIEARNRAKRAENRVSELEAKLKESGNEV